MSFENDVVLITGANRGIGKAFAEGFLSAGARKIYLGVRNPDSVAEFIATHPDRLYALKIDVTNPDDIAAVAESVPDLTLLINNAGVLYQNTLDHPDIETQARHEMEVNYFAPLKLGNALRPVLKSNGGTIVNISSIVGRAGVNPCAKAGVCRRWH